MKTPIYDNSLVITHNDLNKISFPGFDKKELDFLYGTIISLYNQKDNIVRVSFDEIMKGVGIDYMSQTESEFGQWVNSFTSKAAQVICPMYLVKVDGGETFTKVPFFGAISFSFTEKFVEFKANPSFEQLLQKPKEKYTAFSFLDFKDLNKKYSKLLFRQLSQWKTVGSATYKIEELIRLLDAPKSCERISTLRRVVLIPAVKDLRAKFPGLTFSAVKKGQKISAYKFTWDKEHFIKLKQKEIASKKSGKTAKGEIIQGEVPTGLREVTSSPQKTEPPQDEDFTVTEFKTWLKKIDFVADNKDYFDMRNEAMKDILSLYKKKVIGLDSFSWIDVRFFASINHLVKNDKAVTVWNLEDSYSAISKCQSKVRVDKKIYEALPKEKQKQLRAFVSKGKVI